MPTQAGSEPGDGGEQGHVWPDLRLPEQSLDFITMAVGVLVARMVGRQREGAAPLADV